MRHRRRRQPSPTRPTPTADELLAGLDAALAARGDVAAVTAALTGVDAALHGVPGLLALNGDDRLVAAITARLDQLDAYAAELDDALAASTLDADELEAANAASIALRDVLWALRRDRLRTVAAVADLAGGRCRAGSRSPATWRSSRRCRRSTAWRSAAATPPASTSSSGTTTSTSPTRRSPPRSPTVTAAPSSRAGRPASPDVASRSSTRPPPRSASSATTPGRCATTVQADDLLRRALAGDRARVAVLGHTRWASVGIISEPNAHPVNGDEVEQRGGPSTPFVVGVLNGDVDNHADLRAEHGLRFARPITTDAKVIPALVARHSKAVGGDLFEAFRRTVSSFEGSVAIGVAAADEPGHLYLALNGSGQGVYIGLADDCFLVASEPYGVVEETDRYVRLDGEHGGQIVRLDADAAGTDRGHRAPRLRRLRPAGDRGRRLARRGHDA